MVAVRWLQTGVSIAEACVDTLYASPQLSLSPTVRAQNFVDERHEPRFGMLVLELTLLGPAVVHDSWTETHPRSVLRWELVDAPDPRARRRDPYVDEIFDPRWTEVQPVVTSSVPTVLSFGISDVD